MSEQLIKALTDARTCLRWVVYGEVSNGETTPLVSDTFKTIDATLSTHHAAPGAPQQEASGDDLQRFEELLDDYAGACAEVVVFNITQRSATPVRLPRPRREALLNFVKPLLASRAAATAPAGEPTVGIHTLERMFRTTEGVEKSQPGYHHAEGWNAALRQAMDYAQPATAPAAAQGVASETVWPTLKAMAMNYSDGHHWDHLDARACRQGAEEIKALLAALAQAGQAAPAPNPYDACNSFEAYTLAVRRENAAYKRIEELEDEIIRLKAEPAGGVTPIDALRSDGWAVAVHNDYRLNGEPHTFWLLTKGDRCVKGEGRTDGEALAQIDAALQAARATEPAPIDMVLHCPACGMQHIDKDEAAGMFAFDVACYGEPWRNPPHRSHLCHGCGHIWRPADVPTNGVQAVQTKGKADSPPAAQAAELEGWVLMPIEPTPEMRAAIIRQMCFQGDKWSYNAEAVYRDMLAASPTPPTGKEGGVKP